MTMRSIACGACGADVPHGRLSCPACGELLASVSGSLRSVTASSVRPDDRPIVDALLDDDPAPGSAQPATAQPVAAATLLWEPPTEEAAADSAPELDLGLLDADAGLPAEPAGVAASQDLPEGGDPDPGPSWPADLAPSWPDPETEPLASNLSWSPPPAGAYLPPTATPPPAPRPILGMAAAVPAGPAAPAREWAGPGADSSKADVGRAAADGDDERARVDEAIGWVAVGGGTIALLGFLIPWARTMIGSGGDGYVDQWGLAGPGHVVIVLALVGILAGVLVPNRIPAWLRLGVPGLVVGAILIGLVWPYVLGPLGALPGAFLSLAGALTLVGASIASIGVDRHARRRPPV